MQFSIFFYHVYIFNAKVSFSTVPTQPTINEISQNTTALWLTISPGDGECSVYNVYHGVSDQTERQKTTYPCTPGSDTNAVLSLLVTNEQYNNGKGNERKSTRIFNGMNKCFFFYCIYMS